MLNQKSKIFFALALATVLAFLLVLGFTMTIRTNEEENAFAEEIAPTPRVLTDGQYKGEEITLFQGESATFTVSFGEETFLPVLSINEIGGAFLINENKLTVCENSKVGKTKIDVFCILNEDEEFLQTITVEVKYNGTINDIFTTDIDRIMTVTLPEKVEYVDAMVAAQDHSTGINVRLKDGDVVNEIVEGVPHGISGLTFTYTEIGFASIDSTGNSSTQALNGEESGAELVSYSTNSLSGSGTEGSPYGIYDVSDFMSISDYDGTDKFFRQYSNFSITSSFTVKDFYGNYDGNSKTITASNFSNQYALMFKDNHGTIKNLTYEATGITITKFSYLGIICSVNYKKIQNVNVRAGTYNSYSQSQIKVDMSAGAATGLICGTNETTGIIESCYYTGAVKMTIMISGGAAGINKGQINGITGSFTAMFYDGFHFVSVIGGVVGSNDGSGTITSATVYSIFIYINDPTSTIKPSIGAYVGGNNNSSLSIATSSINGGIIKEGATAWPTTLPTYIQTTHIDCNLNSIGDGDLIGWNY